MQYQAVLSLSQNFVISRQESVADKFTESGKVAYISGVDTIGKENDSTLVVGIEGDGSTCVARVAKDKGMGTIGVQLLIVCPQTGIAGSGTDGIWQGHEPYSPFSHIFGSSKQTCIT